MTKLRISDSLSLPPETVTSTVIVYGGKGMGKTNLGGVLVEELDRARLRWAVLDPMGVWWGLRHAKDGKGPGIECLILGGPRGDIPIEPTGGAVVADLVADEKVNVVIDFSRNANGEMWGVGEKIRFVTDYGKRLFQRQGGLINKQQRREPIFQLMDEAARFIPQMIRAGQDNLALCLSVWAQIVEEGRNIGLGVGLFTQRSARLNKDVAELADAMMAFRTVGPNSIEAIVDWLGSHIPKERIKEITERVRSLNVGQCLVVSPGWLGFEDIVQIRERQTFDSSATPRPGEHMRRVTGDAAKPDLAKYAELMSETIERQKENDPAELKRRLAKIKQELEQERRKKAKDAAPSKGIDEAKLKRVVETTVRKTLAARDETWMIAVQKYQRRWETKLSEALKGLHGDLLEVKFDVPERIQKVEATIEGEKPVAAPAGKVQRGGFGSGEASAHSNGLSKSQLNILSALAQFEAIGRKSVPKKWIAVLAGASHNSGGFRNNLSAMRSGGLIDYPAPGEAALTETGRNSTPQVDPPGSPAEMLDRCKQVVSNPQARMLEALHRAYPNPLQKEELAETSGASPASGGFRNNLSALRSAGMIQYPAPGQARISGWVMLEED